MCVCVGLHACVCMHVCGALELVLGIIPSCSSTLFMEVGSLRVCPEGPVPTF